MGMVENQLGGQKGLSRGLAKFLHLIIGAEYIP